jgi:hypothetical protein
MAEINPMYNLVNTIIDDKEVVIFLGAGASMEGTQDGKRFPGFGELIDRILKDWGFDPTKKKKLTENFLEVIQRWENEKILPARLRKYLGGDPGQAHYSLAALSIALVGESNAMLYLTTNYDNLMKKAFTDLERNPVSKFDTVVLSLRPNIIGSEFQGIVNNIEDFTKKGEPVILKLFGDLNSQSPIFRQEDMKFEPEVEKKLLEWMKKPMILIGYSFSDKIIQQLFIAARGNSPVFLVTPSGKKVPSYIRELDRVHLIEKRFSDFIIDLFKIFKQRYPSIIEKADKILESIGFVPIPYPTNEPPETKPSHKPGDFSKIKPKKILILAANPKLTPPLRLDEEVREIKEGLRRSKYRNQFEIYSEWAVRLRDLRRALLDHEPHIVHFIGHGRDNKLLVEDEVGTAVRVSSQAFADLFELCSAHVQCVVLNACYSARQADAISKHINYVIGMRKGIKDKASIEFAVGFYDALGAGKSIEEAFKFACIAIKMDSNLPGHLIPVLKKKEDAVK